MHKRAVHRHARLGFDCKRVELPLEIGAAIVRAIDAACEFVTTQVA